MGYFDVLVGSSFKKDENDNTIFFPWGTRASGYIINDPQKDVVIRKFLKRYYKFSIVGAILGVILFTWVGAVVVLAIVLLIYSMKIPGLKKGLVKSQTKLKTNNSMIDASKNFSFKMLRVMFISSLLFALVGIAIIFDKSRSPIAGLFCAAFFGFASIVFFKMLRIKKANKNFK
ncbi:hypothetical protein KKA47_04440 [bacterium]|nr:hypothetical protein [bacterium]